MSYKIVRAKFRVKKPRISGKRTCIFIKKGQKTRFETTLPRNACMSHELSKSALNAIKTM